jgi:hypothetical protein
MAAIRIVNPNAGGRAAIIYISLASIIPTNERGDNKYVFKIHTRSRDTNGNLIEPLFLFKTSVGGFLKEMPDAVAALCSKINWGVNNTDSEKPYVIYYTPVGNNISLFSSVIVEIEDGFPSSGIDLASICMKVNGFDVTSDIITDTNFNRVRVTWSPRKRVLNG